MKFFLLFTILFYNILNADIVISYTSNTGVPSLLQQVELDKLKEIAVQNNISITFKQIPWKRSLLLLERGRIDGLINASFKKERAEYAIYPMYKNELDGKRRLNDGQSYFIYKNTNSSLKWDGKVFINPDGFIGVMENYAVIEDLKKHKNIQIKTFVENIHLIRNLASKQIAAYAGNITNVNEILKKYPILAKNIIREPIPIRKKDYFLIFSKITYKDKHQEMNTIWNGLQRYNNIKDSKNN